MRNIAHPLTDIRFLQQLVPSEDAGSDKDGGEDVDTSSERPPFSLPTMTNNFRRFNARYSKYCVPTI